MSHFNSNFPTIRLKTILPQVKFIATEKTEEYVSAPLTESKTKKTEVCAPTLPSKSKTEKETGGVLLKYTAVVVDDSSSSFDVHSEDTIDEFVSSEECRSQGLNRSFSNYLPNKTALEPFILPSMLTEHASESITLLDYKPARTQIPEGSSGSATVGTFEQTPIDLSPGNTSTTSSVPTSSSVKSSQNSCIDNSNKVAVESIGVIYFGESASGADCNIHGESLYEHICKQSTSSQRKRSLRDCLCNENSHSSLDGNDEEHTIDTANQARTSTPLPFSSDKTNAHLCVKADTTSDDSSITPKPKRAKVCQFEKEMSHSSSLSSEAKCDPSISTSVTTLDYSKEVSHGSISSVLEIIEPTRTVHYIDLTHDDDDDECLSDAPHATVNEIITKSTIFGDVTPCDVHGDTPVVLVKKTLSKTKQIPTVSPLESDIISEEDRGICPTRDSVTIGGLETVEGSSTRSNELGSPLYLPPTPGREKVDSIFDRKNIAF